MSEALTLDSFAAQLAQSEAQPEQADIASGAEDDQEQESQEDTTDDAESISQEDDDSEEGAESEDGQAEKAPNEEMVIKWTTASGETHEAPLKELKDGYLRHSDYTQKAQQLSQERERATAALYDQYQQTQHVAVEMGRLHNIQEQLTKFQQFTGWEQLQREDPQQFAVLSNQFLILREQGKEALNAVQNKQAQFASWQQQQAGEATQAAADHLKAKISGFGDKHLSAMNSHMLAKGLKEADLPEIVKRLGKQYAPAVLEVIHEAAERAALLAKKPEVENKLKAVPPKTLNRAKSSKPQSQHEQIMKVAQSNRPMDANLFASLLGQTRKK